MIWSVVLLLGATAVQPGFDLAALNRFAQARNESAVAQMARPELGQQRAFRFLNVRGVYGGGGRGWTIAPLRQPNGPREWVVFTTPILAEDIGEQVFEVRNGLLWQRVPEQERFGLTPKHMDMKISFNPGAKQAFFEAEITVAPDGRSNNVFGMARLAPNLQVTAVERNGQAVPFSQAGGTVCFATLPGAQAGGQSKYKFFYRGILNDPPEHGSIRAEEAMLTGTVWWPSIGRHPMTYQATVTHANDWKVFTHGRRLSVTKKDNETVTVYRSEVPFSIFSLSAGRYQVVEKEIKGRKYWVAGMGVPPTVLDLQCDLNAGVIEFMNGIHPFPFDSWGSLISDRFGFGGLEAYSYATYQRGWLPDIDPHEPSHTFWGGVIPNTYLTSLWNESFADFFENYYPREGHAGNREDLRMAFRHVADSSESYRAWPAVSAGCESSPAASPIGYSRGGKVLGMLEQEIGQKKMRESMATWLKNHPKGEPGEWEGYFAVVKKLVGEDIDWFFEQWLRRPGFAEFTVEGLTRQGNQLSGEVVFKRQPYRLRMEVLPIGPSGPLELQTVTVPATQRAKFTVALPDGTTRVSFDPYQRILRPIPDTEMPTQISRMMRGKVWVQSGFDAALTTVTDRRSLSPGGDFPSDPTGMLIFGGPTHPQLQELLKKLPEAPVVQDGKVTWRGQTIELDKGGFLAVVELGGGKQCVVGFGKVRQEPKLGLARAALFDDLGRVMAAVSDPKTTGPLTFDLPTAMETR